MRLVLDTNILVSALINRRGPPALILTAALRKFFDLAISREVLAEYNLVLYRPSFNFPPDDVNQLLAAMQQVGYLVRPSQQVITAKHEPDNRFLECAEAAKADYLITGNLKHFPKFWKTTKIISAREFIERMALHLDSK